jgi:PAS domain S-box-containing protein
VAALKAEVRELREQLAAEREEFDLHRQHLLEAERELNASRERYADLYDFAPVGYATLDRTGLITSMNATGAQILERPRRGLVGWPLTAIISDPDRRKFLEHLRLASEPGRRITTSLRLAQKGDAAPVWIELISIATRSEGGSHLGFRCAFMDVTERRRAENALCQTLDELENRVRGRTQQLTHTNSQLKGEIAARLEADRTLRTSEERLRLMIEGTHDYAICMLDAAGRIATWNSGAAQITGYRTSEILGRHFSSFYTPEDIKSGKSRHMLDTARQTGRSEDEGLRVRKGGNRFWASVIITALRDEQGRLKGYLKVTRDITERRQTQEVLRLSEKYLADFFDRSPLGLLWVGPRGQIRRINHAGLELFGSKLAACLDHPVQEFYADSRQAAEILRRLARREPIHNFRARFRRADGGIRHILIDANGLWEEGKLAYSHWFLRDISRRVELEREILVIAERERQRIGRELHDDLCQQLTGVEFLSQTLAGRLCQLAPKDSYRAREIARLTRQAITRTRELAHGLAPTELETGGLPGALHELAARTRRLFHVACHFRRRTAGMDPGLTVGIDLYRIAQEAVTNAVKHGKASRITIGLVQGKSRLILSVRDDGVGFPNRVRRPKQTGGMGLHAMQYRAGAIGGTLECRSNASGGTTVVCIVNHAWDPLESKATT